MFEDVTREPDEPDETNRFSGMFHEVLHSGMILIYEVEEELYPKFSLKLGIDL